MSRLKISSDQKRGKKPCPHCRLIRRIIAFPIIVLGLLFLGINNSGDNRGFDSFIEENVNVSNANIIIFAGLAALLGFKYLAHKRKNNSE